jgi:hypothetical protein
MLGHILGVFSQTYLVTLLAATNESFAENGSDMNTARKVSETVKTVGSSLFR